MTRSSKRTKYFIQMIQQNLQEANLEKSDLRPDTRGEV